ncbi:MAG TPA: hypothetical protein VJO16_04155 [Candidatus Acidoferrum sp.]|nr:hypothetical protein [Candidatus Acidoferrum sp.]
MPCKPYKDALIEAAATSTEPQGELRDHLDACLECNAAFRQEQALLASIDAGLRVTSNVDVPASLLLRVRAQMSDLSASRRSWVPAWAVLAATAALILTVVVVRGWHQKASGQDPQNSALAHTDFPAGIPAVATGAPPRTNSGQRVNKRSLPAKIQGSASIEHLPVLLPAGQKAAFDAWLDGLRRGKMKANDLLAQKSDLPLQDLQISPLDLSPIEMKPLANVSGESPSQGGDARR